MTSEHGDISLLEHPEAQRLLKSTNMAHLAYIWPDGTPRVVPIWFEWNGQEIVLGTPIGAPKVKALMANPNVALTIDEEVWPYKALMIRGTVKVDVQDGVTPEYAAAAKRYFGEEGGTQWIKQLEQLPAKSARIALTPGWVTVIDFEQRFPSALEKAMEEAQK
ncbi:MAG: pyridoxamine 5'-phosphate oxidase family protein [Anaerolineae bacterium]|nr:pyridoxamine 5'-phosphate oxidase family protein [Anaerolineae bacterium]